MDRRRSVLRSERLPDRRTTARTARARKAFQSWPFLRASRVAHFTGLPRRPGYLRSAAIVARISRNVSSLEISLLRAKYWPSRRHRLLARLVARGRRPILSAPAAGLAFC